MSPGIAFQKLPFPLTGEVGFRLAAGSAADSRGTFLLCPKGNSHFAVTACGDAGARKTWTNTPGLLFDSLKALTPNASRVSIVPAGCVQLPADRPGGLCRRGVESAPVLPPGWKAPLRHDDGSGAVDNRGCFRIDEASVSSVSGCAVHSPWRVCCGAKRLRRDFRHGAQSSFRSTPHGTGLSRFSRQIEPEARTSRSSLVDKVYRFGITATHRQAACR